MVTFYPFFSFQFKAFGKGPESSSGLTETTEASDRVDSQHAIDTVSQQIDCHEPTDEQLESKNVTFSSVKKNIETPGHIDNQTYSLENVVRIAVAKKSHRSRERQMALSLILICIMYLVFTTPYYLYFFLALQPYFDRTPKRYIDMHIAFGFNSLILVQCNAALNIFVLLLVGSKFRKDLFNLLRKGYQSK